VLVGGSSPACHMTSSAYEACREELSKHLARYGVRLLPIELGDVRFQLELGSVVVTGRLGTNLTFDIAGVDSRTGPLVEASHRIASPSAMREVITIALGQFEYYATADTANLDWSNEGVAWWDTSKDELLAREWLAAPGRTIASDDVDDRVLELTQTDLDPARGWGLVKKLVEFSSTDDQLWRIGYGPVSTILREHPDLVREDLTLFYRSDPKWRKPFKGQMSTALSEFERQMQREVGVANGGPATSSDDQA